MRKALVECLKLAYSIHGEMDADNRYAVILRLISSSVNVSPKIMASALYSARILDEEGAWPFTDGTTFEKLLLRYTPPHHIYNYETSCFDITSRIEAPCPLCKARRKRCICRTAKDYYAKALKV